MDGIHIRATEPALLERTLEKLELCLGRTTAHFDVKGECSDRTAYQGELVIRMWGGIVCVKFPGMP